MEKINFDRNCMAFVKKAVMDTIPEDEPLWKPLKEWYDAVTEQVSDRWSNEDISLDGGADPWLPVRDILSIYVPFGDEYPRPPWEHRLLYSWVKSLLCDRDQHIRTDALVQMLKTASPGGGDVSEMFERKIKVSRGEVV